MSNKVKAGHKKSQSYANKRKTGKEQYYTSPEAVDICLNELKNHIDVNKFCFLEPAGGTGEFIKGFQRMGIQDDQIISYDIEPKHPLVNQQNFLETTKINSDKPICCITNPPFGRASSLAKKFFNKAAESSDYIGFLVPKSWRKWSVHNSLDLNFHLIADIDMQNDCFYLPDGTKKEKSTLKTVFQIWQKKDVKRKKIKIKDHGLLKKINKDKNGMIHNADVQLIIFGYSAGKVFELNRNPTKYVTTSAYFQADQKTIDAMRKVDMSKFYNNVAYVQALSINEINYCLNDYFGLSQS